MRLKVLVPTQIVLDEQVSKVTAEAENGSFCLLPEHIDFLAALVPGLLAYESVEGTDVYLAIDQALLIKQDDRVFVSARQAVRGADLGELRKTVHEQFESLDDRQRSCRTAISKLEADFLRRFLEFGEQQT